MKILAPIDDWGRWSVTGLGVLLCGAIVSTIGTIHFELTALRLLRIGFPALLSLGLVAFGGWLARGELPTERIIRIALWCVVGTIVIGSFTIWELFLHISQDQALLESAHELLLGATKGAVVGGLVGYYDVRKHEQYRETKRAKQAISASIDGIALLDEDKRYTQVNQAHADIYGYESSEDFIGESWEMCHTDDKVAEFENQIMPVLETEGQWRGKVTGKRRDGSSFPQEMTLTGLGEGGFVCVARDISDRREREQYISRLIDNLPGMVYRATNEPERPMELVHGTCRELTGYDSTTIQEGAITFGEDIIHPDDQQIVWETVQDALEADERFEIEYRIQTKDDTVKWVWEQGTGVYGEQGQLVALEGFIMDITDRKEFTEMIETLHSATRDMVVMEDTEQVCNTAVETADRLLDLPLTGIWLRDDTGRRLDPVARSDADDKVIDELPVYTPDRESLSWQTFERGETRVYDNLQTEASLANAETPIQSEIIVPLGDFGVMNIGSQTAQSFDETDIHAAELLGANTTTALERVEREQELESTLDRMEFFNSILRHDVLNGMTVIRSRAEFLTDDLEGDQLRDAETVLNWSDNLVGIVQRVQATLDTLTGQSDIQLESVELSETLREELDRVQETYPEVTFETTIPDTVTVQANELLGEVLGNVVTNAVNHNNTEGLHISITASESQEDDTMVVRIADNGKGVPDEAKETIFRRDATGHAKSSGSGFGLFFVDVMVDQYGGDVWVEDNERGGATFVIELPQAEATAQA